MRSNPPKMWNNIITRRKKYITKLLLGVRSKSDENVVE